MKKDKMIREKIRELINQYPELVIDELLENGFRWPKELETDTPYFINHDDSDGGIQGFQISFSSQSLRAGDAYIEPVIKEFNFINPSPVFNSYCFRVPFIGGSSAPQMNMALRILALAIVKHSENYYFEGGEKKEKS